LERFWGVLASHVNPPFFQRRSQVAPNSSPFDPVPPRWDRIKAISGVSRVSLAEDAAQDRSHDSAGWTRQRTADDCTCDGAADLASGGAAPALLCPALCGTLLLNGVDAALALLEISLLLLLLLLLLPHWPAHRSPHPWICSLAELYADHVLKQKSRSDRKD
jgi:hypothetical protein